MSRQPTPHLTPTERLLAEALAMHDVPWRTAVNLVKRSSAAHVLRELCHYNFERGHAKNNSFDWRWLAMRIRLQLSPPRSYPFSEDEP